MKKLYRSAHLVFFIYFSFMIFTGSAFPIDLKNIIAYPVPFNLNKHNHLHVGYRPGFSFDDENKRVKVEIYDINGDSVFTRVYSSINNIWNGRNNKGNLVRPGLYILKISIEDTATGDYGQKMIRILVTK